VTRRWKSLELLTSWDLALENETHEPTPVIPATQEPEIRRIVVQSQPG
jgi:hypothetical protein